MANETFVNEIKTVFTVEGFDDFSKAIQEIDKDTAEAIERIRQLEKQEKITGATANAATKAIQGESDKRVRAAAKVKKATDDTTDAEKRAAQATQNHAASLPRLRYALYDISTTLTIAGGALIGLAAALATVGVTMDRQFADVVRTTGTYMDQSGRDTAKLREEFNALFASIPASWGELTEIGTLAGQLGVAKDNVAEFTKLVAMFASTTDVSVDQAATAFGRLSELLDVPAYQYQNLGSSILSVGVASVATESQIINVSTQIASMGNFAGFSADEVIGLSSALASLGTQPELARGTVTRLFTRISDAVDGGGEALRQFAEVSNMSAEDFADAWKNDAAGAFQAFISGLGGVANSGGPAVHVLKDLGITAARDVPTILRLAQNHKLLAEQMNIAKNGFEEGTTLGEQYGVIAQTVAEKLVVLRNNVQLLVGTLGDSEGIIASIIDGLTSMVQGINQLLSNDATATFTQMTLALTALAGVSLLVAGGFVRMVASGAAAKTAMIELALATGAYSSSADAASRSTLGLAASIGSVRIALLSTGVLALLVAAGAAVAYFVGEAEKGGQRLEALKQSYAGTFEVGSLETLRETEGILKVLPPVIDENAEANQRNADTARDMAATYLGLKDEVDDATQSIEAFGAAVTEGSQRQVEKNLMDWILGDGSPEEQLARVQALEAGLNELGITRDQLVNAVMNNDQEFFSQLAVDSVLGMQAAAEAAGYSMDFADSEAQTMWATLQTLADEARIQAEAFHDAQTAAQAHARAMQLLGGETEETGEDFDNLAHKIKEAVDAITDGYSGTLRIESSLADLGRSIAENGALWDEYSEAGRDNLGGLISVIDALQSQATDKLTLARDFKALFEFLVRGGYASAQQLMILKEVIASLGFDFNKITASDRDFSSFFSGLASGADKAGNAAGRATKQVRTLLDYVSDLRKVMSDSFDFRFGMEQANDGLLSSFYDINDAFEKAREKVRDLTLSIQEYQAEISELTSDSNILEYHLSIAEEYGDTLRAEAIRAELAKVNAKLAKTEADLFDAQKDLGKATEEATPNLEDNTQASIAQRKAVLDLVKSYQEQIEAYAATGASQAQIAAYTQLLKQRFEEQMRTLGFAETSIQRYSASFDDFRKIVERVPRNLTMTVDVDPALRALAEYEAKLKSVNSTPLSTAFDDTGYKRAARAAALQAQIDSLTKALAAASVYGPAQQSIKAEIDRLKNILNSGQYQDGGYTGAGPANQPAGIVHRGEYVIPKEGVNQRTGLPYPDALARLQRGYSLPGYARGGYVSGASAGGVVDLSAMTLQQLQRIFNLTVQLDGKTIASNSGNHYATATRRGAS